MEDLRNGRLDAQAAAVAGDARIIGKLLRMAPDAQIVIRLPVAAAAGDNFGLVVAFEAGTRHDIENAVRAIAVFGAVATGGRLQVVHIFRVKLWPDIRSNVGVGQRHAIDGPGDLMAAAHV